MCSSLGGFLSCSFHSNEHRLLELLTTGPVSAAVDATTWNNYLGGVIQFHCGSADVNHAVEIVGYDKTGSYSGSLGLFTPRLAALTCCVVLAVLANA